MGDLTDAELNTYIRARLAIIGVDISMLPDSDPGAPADQARILSSVRSLLRGTVPVISNYSLDVQENPPILYPAQSSSWTRDSGPGRPNNTSR
jgi:hypothetical protein